MTLPDMTRRRGLPRVAGGSPWPEPYSSTAPASTTRDVVPNVYDSGTDVPASAGGVVAPCKRRGDGEGAIPRFRRHAEEDVAPLKRENGIVDGELQNAFLPFVEGTQGAGMLFYLAQSLRCS